MKRYRAPFLGVLVPVYLSALLVACDDDPADPDPQTFDPTFAVETLESVVEAFVASELPAMMSNMSFALSRDAGSAVAPARFPNLGGTYAYDETRLRWEVDPGRGGAPDDGVRFVWYVMDVSANTPVRPLVEQGWVDVRLDGNGVTTSVMTVEFVRSTGGATAVVVDYTATYQEDPTSGSFAVTAEGRAGEVEFDVSRTFTYEDGAGLYETTQVFGGDMGTVNVSLTSPFDPGTILAIDDSPFEASVFGAGHVLFLDALIDVDDGLQGVVEIDDDAVLELGGTVLAPLFRLPEDGSPSAELHAEMVGLWSALWGVQGQGVGAVTVLEGLFR